LGALKNLTPHKAHRRGLQFATRRPPRRMARRFGCCGLECASLRTRLGNGHTTENRPPQMPAPDAGPLLGERRSQTVGRRCMRLAPLTTGRRMVFIPFSRKSVPPYDPAQIRFDCTIRRLARRFEGVTRRSRCRFKPERRDCPSSRAGENHRSVPLAKAFRAQFDRVTTIGTLSPHVDRSQEAECREWAAWDELALLYARPLRSNRSPPYSE